MNSFSANYNTLEGSQKMNIQTDLWADFDLQAAT
jgi:hypothetical protein